MREIVEKVREMELIRTAKNVMIEQRANAKRKLMLDGMKQRLETSPIGPSSWSVRHDAKNNSKDRTSQTITF